MARLRAPELNGAGGWIGTTAPLTLDDLVGKVVVLDFWTYCCINCIRVLDELRPIQERFAAELVVIGVHSPKFPREHDHQAVEEAVTRHGIDHAVLDDPELVTWRAYGVRVWPTLVLIDPEGYIVGGITGEGSGPLLTQTVEGLVATHRAGGTLVSGPVPRLAAWVPPAAPSGLRYPGKVAVDPGQSRLAIADTGHDRVLVSDMDGRVWSVFDSIRAPQGVRFDGQRVLVCETGADRVLALPLDGSPRETLASGLASPWDIALDTDGSIVVAEAGRHRLWRIAPHQEPVVIAGTGQENLVDGPGADSLLAQPSGLGRVEGGIVFVDAEASALRALTTDGVVVTLVGQGLFDWGASDGGATSAALQHPLGVAVAHDRGTVYVADTFNSLIRAWSGAALTAGAGTLRTLPVEGLEEPGGLDVLADGRLVVADTNHHRVVLVDPNGGSVTPIVLDEEWVGTDPGVAVSTPSGEGMTVPFAVDLGDREIDHDADRVGGLPVRVAVSAVPTVLLGPGPRRWELDRPSGTVEITGGQAGRGMLVVEIDVSVCTGTVCSVMHRKVRHELTVLAPAATASPG